MQIENIYIVEYNKQIISVWNTFESAKTFIMGCQQNRLMNSPADIKTYKINTCFCFETETISLTNIIKPIVKSDTHSKPIIKPNSLSFVSQIDIEDNPKKHSIESEIKHSIESEIKPNHEYVEKSKQKIELQHKINILKQQKKKIDESKITYENDYKLFELFTESKQKDPNFIIPEIFTKKFDLMTHLHKENKLSWDNFVKDFQHDNLYNDYFGLNSYEEMFLESDDENKSDISEELDIESDSSTSTSDSDNKKN